MTEFALFRPKAVARAVPRRRETLRGRLFRAFRDWRRKRRSRRRLADLDDRMLRDIGLSPGDAMREVRKSFPLHRPFPCRVERDDSWR